MTQGRNGHRELDPETATLLVNAYEDLESGNPIRWCKGIARGTKYGFKKLLG